MGNAFYAGLRRGEIMALRNQDVDLEAGVLHVERGWDLVAGPIAPKSRAGRRVVFILEPLARLLEQFAGRWAEPEALFFGSTALSPFEPRNVDSQGAACPQGRERPAHGDG